MAFPSSPTSGQVYKNYIYDSSLEAWESPAAFGDSFDVSSLDTLKWSTFGEQFGSIVVNNGKCIITNSSGTGDDKSDLIGIYSNWNFPVGSTILVRSRNTSGRHASLISFGESPWWPYPHTSDNNSNVSVTWYSRADTKTSTISCHDESNNKNSYQPDIQDLTEYQIFMMKRISSSKIEIYRNDVLEYIISGINISEKYPIYFSADGHTKPNTIEIDWVSVF